MFAIKDTDSGEYYVGNTRWSQDLSKAKTVRSKGYANQLKKTVLNQLEVSGEDRNARIQKLEVKEA